MVRVSPGGRETRLGMWGPSRLKKKVKQYELTQLGEEGRPGGDETDTGPAGAGQAGLLVGDGILSGDARMTPGAPLTSE